MNFSNLINNYFKLGARYEYLHSLVNSLLFIITTSLFIIAIDDIGFISNQVSNALLNRPFIHFFFLVIGILYLIRSLLFTDHLLNRKVFLTNFILGVLLILSFFFRFLIGLGENSHNFFHGFSGFQVLAVVLFILELSRLKLDLLAKLLNPAQLFLISFGMIIFMGGLLLMMPLSTTSPISFIDAIFTSTSAV